MSTKARTVALRSPLSRAIGRALACAALASLPAAALADEEKGKLNADVDFSRPPNTLEGYNKARITATLGRDAKTQGTTVEIKGKAYYPDGVVLTVSLRYWKVKEGFSKAKATVKDKAFTLTLGPFEKTIPGGEIVAEAWFAAAQQSAEAKEKLEKGNYYHCSPPCRWDRLNATRVSIDTGGAAAQAKDEQVEKDEIAKARKALLDAATVARGVFERVRKKDKAAGDPQAALATLEQDRKAALDAFSEWKKKRQLLLFPQWVAQVELLGEVVKDEGRAGACVAGVTVSGMKAETAFDSLVTAEKERARVGDELKGFLDEKDSLDKTWNALGADATARQHDLEKDKAEKDKTTNK